MRSLPTGTVTFFFSDIEASTRLLERLGDDFAPLLDEHRAAVREAFSRHGGIEVGTQGDSFFAVFPRAADAVSAAVDVQRGLGSRPAAQTTAAEAPALRVRIGLHAGEGRVVSDDYVGLDVHRAARIMAAGHGGQILVSDATRGLVERALPTGVELRDLGRHRLRDLSAPERLYQVVAEGLPFDFPPLRTLDSVSHNLPAHVSRLIGRDADLRAVGERVASPARLVTLTGPGGIGKTTLALHVAAEQVDRFRDGIYFVDLAAATDADAVLETIAQVVRAPAPGRASLRDALASHLDGQSILLVLDNFEQAVAAAPAVAELLRATSDLKILVTSREALHVRGEHVIPLAPLTLPRAEFERRDLDEIARSDAVGLFVERAQEARPEFVLTEENAVAVADICARVDGLPLAIELAAARLRLFSPEQLRDRLEIGLLSAGARDLPARQRTLRGAIEWSHDLLDEDERTVFALLSVFAGASVVDVEAVAGRIEELAGVDIVDRLSSLVDKSLVRSVDEGNGSRLTMLETIREYAKERLDARPDLASAARQAHAEHFAEFAHERAGALRGRGRAVVVEDLAADLGNLTAAWRTFLEAGDLARLTLLFDPLWTLHEARGRYETAVALSNDLLRVLEAHPSATSVDEAITLRLSLARGLLAVRGYTAEVEALYRDALALSEAEGRRPKHLAVLRSLASFHLAHGEIDKSAEIGREILELGEQHGDVGLQVEGLVILGPATAFLGDPVTGTKYIDRAIELFDPETHGRAPLRLGPNPGVASLAIAGLWRWLLGYPEAADRYAASAIETATRLGHPYSLAYATFHVALLQLWARRPEVARERALELDEIAEEHDYALWSAISLVVRGVTTSILGDPAEGLALTMQGVSRYENLPTPPVFWPQVLGFKAQALSAAGRLREALAAVEEALPLAPPGDAVDGAPLRMHEARILEALGDRAGAERSLRTAHEQATAFGVPMLALRAATALAQLQSRTGGTDGRELVRATYERFTEGFDTPDLVDARRVLEEQSVVG